MIIQFGQVVAQSQSYSIDLKQLIQRRYEVFSRTAFCNFKGKQTLTENRKWTDNHCVQHDIVLFGGINCLMAKMANDEQTAKITCDTIKNSQASNGQWFRGDFIVDKFHTDGIQPSSGFSRDMALGVFSYLLAEFQSGNAEQAKTQAINWIKWLTNRFINNKGITNLLCTNQITNECNLTPHFAAVMYAVFYKIGVRASDFSDQHLWMQLSLFYSSYWTQIIDNIEISFHSLGFSQAFEVHLKAITYILLAVIEGGDIKTQIQKNIDKLVIIDNRNPLHQILVYGSKFPVAKEILNRFCPVSISADERDAELTDFFTQSPMEINSREYDSGLGCLFVINLLFNFSNNKLRHLRFPAVNCPQYTTIHYSPVQSFNIYLSNHGHSNGMPVCHGYKDISIRQCHSVFGGAVYQNHCFYFHNKDNPYIIRMPLAEKNKECAAPYTHQFVGHHRDDVVCLNRVNGVDLEDCKFKNVSNLAQPPYSFFYDKLDGIGPKYCWIYRFGWWEKLQLLDLCPRKHTVHEIQKDWNWPLCKKSSPEKVRYEDCPKVLWSATGDIPYISKDGRYCGKKESTYFKALQIIRSGGGSSGGAVGGTEGGHNGGGTGGTSGEHHMY